MLFLWDGKGERGCVSTNKVTEVHNGFIVWQLAAGSILLLLYFVGLVPYNNAYGGVVFASDPSGQGVHYYWLNCFFFLLCISVFWYIQTNKRLVDRQNQE